MTLERSPRVPPPASAPPKAPRGSERDDAIHHHPGICSTALLVIATRHPTGFRRGLLIFGACHLFRFIQSPGNSCTSFGKKTCSVDLERDTRLRSLIDGCRDFAEFEQVLGDRLKFSPGPDTLLFIDESQESRQLGRFVRFMKEDWRDATVILSGSTLSRLFHDDVRYPVGRVQQVVVSPFSCFECLVAIGESPLAAFVRGDELPVTPARHERRLELFDGFLATGGLPAVVLAHAAGHDHREVLAQIAADYERDFIRIFGERDADIVTSCFRSVANFVGSLSKIRR